MKLFRVRSRLISLFHRLELKIYRLQCTISGEVYFDKYEIKGPYHWQQYYDRGAPFYINIVDQVVKFVPKHTSVLDIGCGDGLLADLLAKNRYCVVTGIDSNPLAISFARKKNCRGNMFYVRSAYRIGWKSKFDVVVAAEIFEHIRRPEVMLQRAKRALKKGGIFIVSTPLFNKENEWGKYHVKEYTKEELHEIIEKYFVPEQTALIDRPDGKSNSYLILARKKEERNF